MLTYQKIVAVELYAASANSQTKYTAGDELLFNIPSYQKVFIDFSKSYMKFMAKSTNSSNSRLKVSILKLDSAATFWDFDQPSTFILDFDELWTAILNFD